MRIRDILKEFREELENLYENKLKSIILYGSWARGDATGDSDIDMLLFLKEKSFPEKKLTG
ncbi:type I restriction enzyme, S subunit [Candidatus Methanophagaceae archaeon]|nr:type I restriction enzyme, S subunit [Methanophagales archaeon]